jgi:hypothetical protein
LLGFLIGAGSVIAFFKLGIGTDTLAFAGLHDQPTTNARNQTGSTQTQGWAPQHLTVHNTNNLLGSIDRAPGSDTQRSQGMFRHPAIPASLCGLILPIVLAYLLVAQNHRDRILLGVVYGWGVLALLLTFSRAGLIGFIAGTCVFFAVGGWSRLISQRLVTLFAVASFSATILSMPLLMVYFGARSETFFMRFNMMEAAVLGYAQHPLLGVGLNNGTASMKESRQELRDRGVPVTPVEPADSYYLAVVSEVGPVGTVLYFGFFAQIVIIALRAIKQVSADMKPLLVGMVAGLASLATQSLGDGPLAGHAVGGTLWLFAALIVAIPRLRRNQARPATADRGSVPGAAKLRPAS